MKDIHRLSTEELLKIYLNKMTFFSECPCEGENEHCERCELVQEGNTTLENIRHDLIFQLKVKIKRYEDKVKSRNIEKIS